MQKRKDIVFVCLGIGHHHCQTSWLLGTGNYIHIIALACMVRVMSVCSLGHRQEPYIPVHVVLVTGVLLNGIIKTSLYDSYMY